MREKLKQIWKNILDKDYSEDTIAPIMSLLIKTNTPEETLNQIINITTNENQEQEVYRKLNQLKD